MKIQNIQYLLAIVFSSLFVASTAQAARAIVIAAGYDHTCALTTTGGVKCWGSNNLGELGNNTTADKYTPVDVVGLSSGVGNIAAGGSNHTCVVTAGGGVKCWGYNFFGELGDNQASGSQSNIPVDVVGLSSGISTIAPSGEQTCALTTSGGVKCWGFNYFGYPDGSYASGSPVDVVGLGNGVSAIAAGGDHSCVLTTAGGVKCWGANWDGELGDNTTIDKSTPVDVVGLSSGVSAIAGQAYHTCALMTGGGVKCWGGSLYGELGDSTTKSRSAPVDVVGLSSGVSAIAAGEYHTCALTTAGGVKCWGYNGSGQLGDNTMVNESTPVDVVGLSRGVSAITAGGNHTCALTTTGGVKCWGWNQSGQLGDNQASGYNSNVPVNVLGFQPAKNDFDGDGNADVLFLNSATGATQYWQGATIGNKVYPGSYDNVNYNYVGSGDFDDDGKADLLFVKTSNNATLIWSGAKKSAASFPGTGTAGFSVAAICDADGNGKDDIVWYNPTTGKTQIWPSAIKARVHSPGIQDTAFSLVACADFDGDGRADFFWHNSTTGANQIWFSANQSTSLDRGINTDLTLTVVGAGDIDGNGTSDLVWYQPATGAIVVWKNGELRDGKHGRNATSTWVYLGTKDTSFTPKAIGDYDGDGKADLLWGNDTTRVTEIWPAFIKANATYPGTYPSGFSIQK